MCLVEGCKNSIIEAKGLCDKHYRRVLRYGRLNLVRAENGKARTKTRNGYIRVNHNGRLIYEHIVIAEKALGRPLKRPEQVHHLNGIKSDNSPSNLVICPDQVYHKMLHRRSR